MAAPAVNIDCVLEIEAKVKKLESIRPEPLARTNLLFVAIVAVSEVSSTLFEVPFKATPELVVNLAPLAFDGSAEANATGVVLVRV
jgi:hypothetical protein